jgi:arabinan endo-1,5-alpha-L-arabinosidase
MLYHAVDARRPRETAKDELNTRRVMLIDRIKWVGGWPVMDGPTATPQPAPAR